MSWFTAVLLFVIVWWILLFTVLPWGVRPEEQPGEGHAEGAPANPRIGRKMLVTTGLALVVWGIIFGLVEADFFSFRDVVADWW